MRKFVVLLAMLFVIVFTPLLHIAQAQSNTKVLRIALTTEPPALLDYFDVGQSYQVTRMYMQPQWGTLPDGKVVPVLVDQLPTTENGGLSQTPDGNTIIKFKIADWAVWSDGKPIVADDFILVYDVATDGISNFTPAFFVKGAKVVSIKQGATPKDVVMTFGQSLPHWMNAGLAPLPAHVLRAPYEAALKNKKGMNTMVDYLRAPTVGDGPFVFAEWQPGQFVRFKRNANYWKTPYFDEVVVSFYPDNNVVKQLLASGDTDLTLDVPFLDALDLVKQHKDTLQINAVFGGERTELEMNQGPNGFPALKDATVRKAIAMGIDRKSMVDTLFNGQSKVPRSYWDDTPWFNKKTQYIDFDADGAKALLKKAGWYDADGDGVIEAHGVKGVADNTPFVLKAATLPESEFQNMMLTVQDMLGKIGIKVSSINQYPLNVFYADTKSNGPYTTGAADLYILHWSTNVETINQYQLYTCDEIPTDKNPSGLNGSQICNPEIDKAWDVLGKSMSADERQAAADRIQDIMANDVLTIYLANRFQVVVLNKNLQGFAWGGYTGVPWISLGDTKRAS